MPDTTTYGTTGNDILSGGNGTDTIYGDDGDDIISGGNGVDNLFGEGGNDELYGDNGADSLTGGADDDLLDGLLGFDTAYYSGPIGEYSFFSAAGYLHIVHLGGAGADGHDRVIRVERLVFADRVIDIGSGTNAPVAGDDHVLIDEDTGTHNSGAASVLDNDFDFDGDALTVTGGTFVGAYGTLTLNANGTYSYTLTANLQGMDTGETVTDSFNYTVTDNDGSDTGALVFDIAGLNDAPVANDDTNSTTEDAAVSGNVLTNDTDVDVEPLVVANPGTYAGAYGTLELNADGSYTYTPNAAAQALDDGEVVNDAFGYTASDGTASDTATLTVTVNGANDAPVANDDTNSTTEEAAVSGNVLANDTDVDVEPLTVTNPGTYVGTYGTLVLAADGSYTYTPNAAAQGLDDGEVVSDAFGYTASDGTASDTATLTVNVAGLNDAPVANDDTNSTTEDAAASGNVLTNDTDVDVEPLVVANPGTYAGTYGTLVLASDGSYTYTPNAAAQALDDGEVVNDAFGYTASDGTASDTATLTVTVNGANDAPVANDDTASTNEDTAVSGNVLTNDTDVDVEPLTVTNPGTYVGTYGTLTLAANGSYTYTPNAAADGLAAGESAQDIFGYTASDGTVSDTASLTVTVNGTNDAPTIDAGGTDASGSVTELPNNDPNENAFTHTDSGTIAFDDLDLSDTHSASFTPQAGGYLGSFSLDPVNQGGDTVGWDFSVEDSAIDFLDEGDTLTQIYTVEIADGNGGTVTQDVTVTITGEADATPPDGTNWYIDNSAVGSAETGSPSDPFTSIAAFNAAQGTLGGPGTGDNIFLLAGTGTYTEADGINLLNGQVLTGVAAGALRPTIVVTGAGNDGIELAQNNTVSGLDIGNTADAGIVDGNGSVGTLTISDVGKSGTGQIVDIDQGGTLNVTLNSAESLASNDGAIDLAGVGGSFTVTGATTITGIHSDGGIDITASSLTATFSGGGTVSTNNAIAVNFVGNTGALALGGGFDIVTTTGAGLNATGGGTVTATGSGNSVTTLTGLAINVSGTAIGAADLTFESVSANGGAYGIRLNGTGAAGGLHITGTGTTDGSGGTIQNISTRGIELINTVDVVIDNMALTNANTANGTSTDLDVSNSNAAIFMSGVTGASLGNVDISTAADSGVVGINVVDFVMDNSTITLAGNGLNESGMEFVNLSGDSSVSNSTISFSETNALDILNTDVSLNLVLDNVTFSDSQTTNSGGPTNPNGEGGLQFRSFSTAAGAPVTNIDVIDSDFLRIRTQAIQIFGNDDSVLSVDVTNNVIDSGAGIGTGIELNASGSSQFAFNVIGNTVTSRSGNAINVTTLGGGDIEGRINDNVVTANTSGAGIRVSAQDNGSTAIVEMRDNSVTMGTGNGASAIDVLSRFGDARLDLTLDNNTLDSNTTALADINITAGASLAGETAQVYANIINNDVLAGGPTNALRLRTADLNATSDPRIFLEGFIEAGVGLDDDAVATWNANGNTPIVTATQVVVTQTAGATSPSAGVALVPDNASPLMAGSLAGRGALHGELLTQSALDIAVDAAIRNWADAGASADELAMMRDTSFAIADLAGLDLGLHTSSGVLIDSNAAGFGWSGDGSGAGMDLVTVVAHELGHAIGLGDHYSATGHGDGMHGYLDVGESWALEGAFEVAGAMNFGDGAGWGDVSSYADKSMLYHDMIVL